MDQINPTVDELQRRFEIVSPSPRIANSLRALVSEGNTNPDEIIALIRLEPLLATRILREANQLPDGKIRGYASIEEAVTAIGFQRMYDLLGLYSYQSEKSNASYSTDTWKRAVTCAVCMESLAEKHNLDTQRAYTLGLIHSIASAILNTGENTEEPNGQQSDSLYRINHRLKSFNSAGLCNLLLRDWNFPTAITDPVQYQYAPLDCQTTGKMACLLNLSKWITGVVREVDELPDQVLGPDMLVLNLLGEGEQTLWNLVSEVSDSLLQADAVLQGKYSTC